LAVGRNFDVLVHGWLIFVMVIIDVRRTAISRAGSAECFGEF
jgi:hypothetical protein